MSLPIIETPKYSFTVPSTQKAIEFRPYLVKEEKILMLAMETKDEKSMIRALKDVIRACSFEKIDPDDLTLVDMQYLFIKLRAISVGEIVDLQLRCQNEKCNALQPFPMDLSKVEPVILNGTISNTIQLTDKVGITMKPVTLKRLARFQITDSDKSQTDVVLQVIAASIETVFDDSNSHRADDQSVDDLLKFIDSLSSNHMTKIREWLDAQPRIEKKVDFCCKKCSAPSSITLTGIQSFFS